MSLTTENKNVILDKAYGALIGHAIGDSFGDAARTEKNKFNYGITTDFSDDDAWSTDDTDFALLTAQTILDNNGSISIDNVVKSWQKYVAPLGELNRGGASEMEGMNNIKKGIMPPLSGQYNAFYMSDGAAMRITPIGIISAGNPAKAAQLAEIESCLSHWREGIWGAQAVAASISVAMVSEDLDKIIDAAINVIPDDTWFKYSMETAFNIIDKYKVLEDIWMPLHKALWSKYKAVVPEAVTSAFAVLKMTGGDFKKGVIYGGNFGRDSDTIAAIVGAVSGAMNGAKSIPEKWKGKTRYPTGTCLPFTKGLDIFQISQDLTRFIK